MNTRRVTHWINGLLCALVIALAAGPTAPPRIQAQGVDDWTTPYRPAMLPDFAGDMQDFSDAPRYTLDLALAVMEESAVITGHQAVICTNRLTGTPLDEIVFRLYPNYPSYGGEMQVSSVTADGVPVDPALDATRSVLSVPLPAPLQPGSSVTVEMDFSVTVLAGVEVLYDQFSYLDGVLALPNAYPVLSVYEPGAGWWQVTDHPQGDAVYSETAFYQVSITAPSDLILAASGSEVDLTANQDDTLTHHYVAPLMRDFALVASTRYVTVSGEQDGTRIALYYDPDKPAAAASARVGLLIAQDAVRIFNENFGRYPFAEFDIVQTGTSALGIEYPGLIVLSDAIWNQDDVTFLFVLVHEAAHQWWYSLVGNDQTLNPWIDESLAQYAVTIFIGNVEGHEAYTAALGSYRRQYESFVAGTEWENAVIGMPVIAYPDGAYRALVYQRGPLFFGALADEYGYEAVIQMLQAYFAAYCYRIAEPDGMLNSFEATLGKELDPIFQEWVGDFPVG